MVKGVSFNDRKSCSIQNRIIYWMRSKMPKKLMSATRLFLVGVFCFTGFRVFAFKSGPKVRTRWGLEQTWLPDKIPDGKVLVDYIPAQRRIRKIPTGRSFSGQIETPIFSTDPRVVTGGPIGTTFREYRDEEVVLSEDQVLLKLSSDAGYEPKSGWRYCNIRFVDCPFLKDIVSGTRIREIPCGGANDAWPETHRSQHGHIFVLSFFPKGKEGGKFAKLLYKCSCAGGGSWNIPFTELRWDDKVNAFQIGNDPDY